MGHIKPFSMKYKVASGNIQDSTCLEGLAEFLLSPQMESVWNQHSEMTIKINVKGQTSNKISPCFSFS